MALFQSRTRSSDFIERLSLVLVVGALFGGWLVLADIRVTFNIAGTVVEVGKDGFSPEIKGAVVQSMLIAGFGAVVSFWLGATKQGQEQATTVNQIAATVPVAAAAAVAAALPTSVPVWTKGTEYKLSDPVISPQGVLHVCIVPHTASDWDADLSAGKWAPKTS